MVERNSLFKRWSFKLANIHSELIAEASTFSFRNWLDIPEL